jgi:signal transduction histidine kinase
MAQHRLADFIRDNLEQILQAWEDFARTIEPPALTMDDEALRDHARQMLQVFAADLATPQSDQERIAKSKGLGKRKREDTSAETHAETRLLSGYTVVQLVSEYRALRSSVLTLWSAHGGGDETIRMNDMTRFNEAVDQALAESVARYELLVKQSQNMFLAILGHDLRNPLSTLATGAALIARASDVPEKHVLTAKRMLNSSRRMGNLVNDLIDYTRTHLGPGIPVRPGRGSLVAVCDEVVGELRVSHPGRRIELRAPAELEASFDEGRISQVLSNLIGNAIQYGSANSPVHVHLSADRDEVVISVNNRGAAIPADQLTGMFDPLVRLANAGSADRNEASSLGIGLFISREIVQAHDGLVTVESNGEDGTTFTVTMPRWCTEGPAR